MTMPLIASNRRNLPKSYDALVRMAPPQAIADDVAYTNAIECIDELMQIKQLSADQRLYLETWVQLVAAYEQTHHAIDTDDVSGLDALRFLLEQNDMNASDLARLLNIHASMGSKILKGDRSLTVDHVRTLAKRFKVSPSLFLS